MNEKLVVNEEFGYKGLQEPLEKRSVEGDLGLRYSASHVYELKTDLHSTEFDAYINEINNNPHLSSNIELDTQLASTCVDIATQRHVGRLETSYTPMGISYYQTGKDCRNVKQCIGIGGPIIYNPNARSILSQCITKPNQKDILLI